MNKKNFTIIVIAFCFITFFNSIKAQYITFVIDNATQTYVTAINDSNFIAGYFEDGSGTHGFIFNGIDTFKVNYPGAAHTYIYGLNNNMVVVGSYTNSSSLVDQEGFSYNHKTGVYNDITTSWLSAMDNTIARDINDNDCIIGDYKQSTTHVAFSMCGGNNTPFHYNYNPTYVYGINNYGSVVGLWIDGSNRIGLVKHGTNWTEINFPGATKTNPTGINDKNVIVGVYDLTKSFIYENGVFKQLKKYNVSDFQVRDINNDGSLAGYYKDPASGKYFGFYMPKWDIKFRPKPNGWKFGNGSDNIWPQAWYNKFDYSKDPYLGGDAVFPPKTRNPLTLFESKLFPDWPLFVDVFGESSCYIGSGPYKVFRGATVLKWKKLAKNWGGSCFGFVQTSYMVWDSIQLFKEFFPKTGPWISDKLYDLPLNEHNRKSINYMMVSQMRKQLLTYYTALWGKGPVYTLQQTKKMMSDTTSNDYRGIAMWNTNGPGGHIVNPYKILIDSIDQNIEYIYVYDNNMPNDTTRKITIKKNENKWYYNVSPNANAQASQWGGNNATYGLLLSWKSSDFYSKPETDSIWYKTSHIEIYPTVNSNTLITSSAADSIGYVNGKLINNTIDAQPMFYFNSNDPEPYGYLLPEKPYSVLMQNYTDTYVDLTVANSGKIFSYNRNDGDLADKDIFNVGTHFSVVNPNNINKIFNLETYNNSPTDEMNVFLGNIGVSAYKDISFRWLTNNALEVINNSTATTYDLELRYASSNGEFNFKNDDIAFDANTTHIITPDWNNLNNQDVTIYIDNGNNGANDDTLDFANELASKILISDYQFDISSTALVDTIHITNTGGGTLTWNAASNQTSWLNIISGSTGANSGKIILSINANTGSSRSGQITITATGAVNTPVVVDVKQNGLLSSPANLIASDGEHYDAVHLNWDAVAGATHYKVYRSSVAGSLGSDISGWISNNNYVDNTAGEGELYYYSITAAQSSSGLNQTAFSEQDEGWRLCFNADFSFNNTCTGLPVLFEEKSNAHNNVWYLWDIDNNGSIDYEGNEFTHNFTSAANVDVTLYITDSLLCSKSITKTVNVLPFPITNLPDDTTICHYDIITLNAPAGYDSYYWSDGTSGNSITVSHPAYNIGDNYIYLQLTNSNGCTTIDTTVVNINTCGDVPVFDENKFNLNIYPNPSNSIVNIEVNGLAGITDINIFNINGQQVLYEYVNTVTSNWVRHFDLKLLPKGLYFVRIINKDKAETRKLILY